MRHDSFEHVQNDCGLYRSMPIIHGSSRVMAIPPRTCYGCITVYHTFLNRGRSGRKIVTVWPRLKSCNQCIQPAGLLGPWFRKKEVESAAGVGLCCTHSAARLFSEFPISQGNAEALERWGGKTKHCLTSYFLRNTSAKNYRNWIVWVKIITSQRWDVFWDTVYMPVSIVWGQWKWIQTG